MNRLTLFALLLAPLAGSLPAGAQDGPSFDCAATSSEAETLVCDNPDLAALDRRVASAYAASLDALKDAGDAAEKELRAEQRGWLSGRDDCWKADDVSACVADAYERRESELIARYMLQEPFNTVSWTCAGNPANEIVTAFFDTPVDTVRIERGDTVDIGFIARSGSGSKYDASHGRWIWLKGDTARYREADPDGSEIDCTENK